jgi:hypothetical protein
MPLSFLLDEHLRGPLWKAIQRHNQQNEYLIDAARVGDPPDLPLRSADSEILLWAERENRIVITLDENTLPSHLAEHLNAGRHSPGVFIIRDVTSLALVVSFLEVVAHASEAHEWQDNIHYVP